MQWLPCMIFLSTFHCVPHTVYLESNRHKIDTVWRCQYVCSTYTWLTTLVAATTCSNHNAQWRNAAPCKHPHHHDCLAMRCHCHHAPPALSHICIPHQKHSSLHLYWHQYRMLHNFCQVYFNSGAAVACWTHPSCTGRRSSSGTQLAFPRVHI